MVSMICRKPHEYRQRMRVVGERFDVDEGHVQVLTAIGHAEVAADQPPYLTRDMAAVQPAEYETRDIPAVLKRKRGRPRKVR